MLILEPFAGQPDEWDAFVHASANGTIFQRQDFLAYHGDRFRGRESHLAWREKNTLKAVLPLGLFPEQDGLNARSPYGASYGGIVHRTDLSLAEAEEMVGLLMDHLHDLGAASCTITPAPPLYHVQASNYIEFFLLKAGFRSVNSDLTAFIPVVADPLSVFHYGAAKAVRKALREGLRVEESRDVDAFYDILVANRRKHDAVPTHSREEVRWLLANLPEDIRLFMALSGDRPAAGTLVFRCNPRVLLDFYWAHLDEFQQLRPINLLVHEVSRWAAGQGLSWFDFGTQTVGMTPSAGGSRFKETFGSTGMFRHTYRWDAPRG